MQKIVGVRKDFDKEIYFYKTDKPIKIGDKVVIQLDDFLAVAKIVKILNYSDKFKDLYFIKRIANENDLNKFEELKNKAKQQLLQIKKASLKLNLQMKFIGAEYSLDSSKIVVIFSSEDRVDFRQLLKDIALFLKTRIELKQIGQRDEVKVCGGVGPCGQECCCSRFLKDFEQVSIKMAKVQGLALAPTKINGICGRLLCCLAYESKFYEKVVSKMPKIGSEVICPKGKGIAVYNDILREKVSVKRQTDGDSVVVEDYFLSELKFNQTGEFRSKNIK